MSTNNPTEIVPPVLDAHLGVRLSPPVLSKRANE
jgi:hypothetical protein